MATTRMRYLPRETVPTSGADASHFGFKGRKSVDESPEAMRQTRLAVERAKGGDNEAIRFLYVRYSDNVYGFVRSIVRDDYEAEDVTQHVFAKLMTSIGKYDDRGLNFLAWLLRLARNAAIDHIRANRTVPYADVGVVETRTSAETDQAMTLREALAALPEDQREVVVLRHFVGLPPGEIADRLGKTESSIHGLHHRGRRALRQELEQSEAAPSTLRTHRKSREFVAV